MRRESILGEELGNNSPPKSFSCEEACPEAVAAIGGNGVIAQGE